MRLDIHFHNEDDRVLQLLEKLMLNTAPLLAAVEAAHTELQSWKALVAANTAAQTQLSADLKAAIAANDPIALAQVQTDLDNATAALSADNAEASGIITANTPAAPGA
jgi:hypothetical protein